MAALASDYILVYFVERKAKEYLPSRFFKRRITKADKANAHRKQKDSVQIVVVNSETEKKESGGDVFVDEELVRHEEEKLRRARKVSQAQKATEKTMLLS